MEEVELSANKFKPLEEKEVKNCDVAFQFFTDTQQRLVEIDREYYKKVQQMYADVLN